MDYETQHIEALRTLAPECMVLLKSKGDFPLEGPCRISLYGNAARKTIKGGSGSGEVNSRYYVTIEEGLKNAGFEIVTGKWMDAYEDAVVRIRKAFIKEVKKEASRAHMMASVYAMGKVMPEPEYDIPLDGDTDTAIYVLGRICGEGNDRRDIKGDFRLTDCEMRDIKACSEKYKHFMLVLNVGAAIDISSISNYVDNILYISQLGVVTGDAFADVVLGKANPSGKLTATWAAADDYQKIGDFGDIDNTRYKEGLYVGYKYFDSCKVEPTYPFGFGLSYTTFSIDDVHALLSGSEISIECSVKNTGKYAGKEVVQLYATLPWGRLTHPYQKLVAYQKTGEIEPGRSEKVKITFAMEDIAGYEEQTASYVLEKGDYIIRIGNGSRNTIPAAIVRMDEEVVTCKLANACGKADYEEYVPEHFWKDEDVSNVSVLTLTALSFKNLDKKAETVLPSDKAMEYVKGLTDEELAYFVVGHFQDGHAAKGIVGNAGETVAGAAGESCSRFREVPPMVMADGPAGLRLSKDYCINENGKARGVQLTLPEDMVTFMNPFAKLALRLARKKPKGEIHHQYCTAIPIGTAIAQSWNPELAEKCGDIVGKEMDIFGVDLWLAPAFNIQRTPLLGRNFEYYSEDPYLSGITGAAITNGVQKHPGRGVTIKHYCCNNQEYNRIQNNSIVSERVVREVYIKAFEICVKKAQPVALMTSYNLLNGVHTSESRDLITRILREEWGYKGIVMSDWIVRLMNNKASANRLPDAPPSIAAGNDVFMPGGDYDHKQVIAALKGTDKNYKLSRQEVEICAARIVDMSWKLKKMQGKDASI